MRKTEVQKAAFNAFNAFALACNSATQALRETLVSVGITTLEDAEPLVTAWASERYSVGLVESKSPRNKGEMVLDRSAPGFEAAKKARYRILEALKGDADSEADPERIRRKLDIGLDRVLSDEDAPPLKAMNDG